MTNSSSTPNEVLQTGGRRRRVRPFLKGTLAAIVAVLGVGVFASPAFGHTSTVSGVTSCASNDYSITWTITNDYPEIETATVTSVTGGLATLSDTAPTVAATGPSGLPLTSTTITQTLPASTTGPITIDITSTWPNPDPFTLNISNSVTLPASCPAGVTVTKSIGSPTPPVTLSAGSPTPVVYDLTIANTSTGFATSSAVNITDSIPTNTTYVPGSAQCVTGGSPTCSASESGSTVTFGLDAGLAAGASYVVSFAV